MDELSISASTDLLRFRVHEYSEYMLRFSGFALGGRGLTSGVHSVRC
jgi:hypothetical protein